MNKIVLLFAAFLLISACGFSDEERAAANVACDCSKDKTIEGVRDCIRNAALDAGLNPQKMSYDRAFRDVCPDIYKRIMDFAKGKTKGRDEILEQETNESE